MTSASTHEPVLVAEVLSVLMPSRGGLFVDCTVGLGGHARALLDGGARRLIGLDRDTEALSIAARALAGFTDRVELVHSDYRQLGRVLQARDLAGADGILADLGVSSMQLEAEGRGFSFRRDEALDMRMDQSEGLTAADLLARVGELLDVGDAEGVAHRLGKELYDQPRIAGVVLDQQDAEGFGLPVGGGGHRVA